MKKYIVDEEWLKSVLVKASTYEALAAGGVNKWEWCEESIQSCLDEFGCSTIEEVVEKEILPYCEEI